MEVYEGIAQFHRLKNAIVTSGTFDGVHKGHQVILKRLHEIAKKSNGETVLITFWPHPRMVLNHDKSTFLKLINTFDEKKEYLAENGIAHLIKIHFTEEFALTSSEDFIKNILVDSIGTKKLVIGYNHRFGRNREGSFENLIVDAPKYGFEVEEIPRHEIDHIGISSTKIRKALNIGDIETANLYLGRNFVLNGKVIHGDKLGRKLGFPTANIHISETYKLRPATGIYAIYVRVRDNRHKGMLNIGLRPTIDGTAKRVEVHILNFNQNIYDESIQLEFIKRFRDEKKFKNLDALRKQLEKDRTLVNKIL
ncbi:bifunctional riboflavin kinase/FAD synthetase [Bacteroidota bacterium]